MESYPRRLQLLAGHLAHTASAAPTSASSFVGVAATVNGRRQQQGRGAADDGSISGAVPWTPAPGPSWHELQQQLDGVRNGVGGADWAPLDVDAGELATLLRRCPDPLRLLARGAIPAVIVRGAFKPEHCTRTVRMFMDLGLMRDPKGASDTTGGVDAYRHTAQRPAGYGNGTDTRIDLGASLVNLTRGALCAQPPCTRGGSAADDVANRENYMAHAASSHALFSELFGETELYSGPQARRARAGPFHSGRQEDELNPILAFYQTLGALASPAGKTVLCAHEPAGQEYGPGIFRIHYDGWAYAPHVNHVRLGDQLYNFSVSRFAHQFAGLICVQNSERHLEYGNAPPGPTIYRCGGRCVPFGGRFD
jgi:hypothetical protein